MLHINPTNSSQLAHSVQRDYQQAAANHRLSQACRSLPKRTLPFPASLPFAALVAVVTFIGQLSSI